MHSELELLLRTIIGRICKPHVWPANTTPSEDIVDVAENLVPSGNVIVSDDVKTELSNLKDVDTLGFLYKVRQHYIASFKHVMLKSGFRNSFLKYCRCLAPSNRKSARSSKDIVQIAKQLPMEIKTDTLSDEWILLSSEPEAQNGGDMRIDDYWTHFFALKTERGEPKYPLVSVVVQATLSVSHGNADVERGFSTSARILSEDRASLSERTLNALMTVKGALRFYDNRPQLVPMTKSLLMMGHKAYQSYKLYLENEKRKKEEEKAEKQRQHESKMEEERSKQKIEELKSTIEEKQEELKTLRKDEEEKRRTADKYVVDY